MKLEIQNAHIIDPANTIDGVYNLYINDDSIAAIGEPPEGWQADKTIDCEHHYLIPGIIDIATRLREPGLEHKATIESETYAAVSGGVTSVVCLPDHSSTIDTPAEVNFIQERSNALGHCHVYVIGALTKQLQGDLLSEMAALKEAGVIGVTNGLKPLASNLVLKRALEYASDQDLTVFIQPLDHDLASNGCIHEGLTATRMGLAGIPISAETSAVASCLALIEHTRTKVHFCRISAQRTLKMLARAKFDGAPISADVCIHQLFLSDQDIKNFDGNYHVIPPFRSRSDVEVIRAHLNSDVISSLCSDHQPHEPDAKLAPFSSTEPGVSALETLLPLTLRLVEENVMSLSEAVALLTSKPAKLLGLNAGTLSPGSPADFCIIDANMSWTLSEENMHSHGKNTPFLNETMKGKVTHTFVDGALVYKF